MDRRDVMRVLGAGFVLPMLRGFSPDQLHAAAAQIRNRLPNRLQGYTPVLLDELQYQTVTVIAEHILPATDTPGATEAGVGPFIDIMLAEWYEAEDREEFLEGLANLDDRSTNMFGATFLELGEAKQVALLRGLDAEVTALQEADLETDSYFFHRMKWLTLFGYYTSEIGQTQELQAAIIPGRYDPCAPLQRDTPGEW